MEEPLIIKVLRDERAAICGQIAVYQAQIAQAKYDLACVSATIRVFTESECQCTRYIVSLSLAHRQLLFAVEPIDPIDPRGFALAAQQDEQPPITEPAPYKYFGPSRKPIPTWRD